MKIAGKECLVIGLTLLLMGDTPALKGMVGLSPSVSPSCYVRMPCRMCEVLMENLYDAVKDVTKRGASRTLRTLNDFLISNDGATGVPNAVWLREHMKQWGFLRICELIKLHNQPSSDRMGIDTMHAMNLGVLVKHFWRLVKILTRGEGINRRLCDTVWKVISSEFGNYCRLNKISAFWTFNNKKEFKMRMTAGSMKLFTQVSGYIIKKLGLITGAPSSQKLAVVLNWQKQVRAFNYWCLHAKIAAVVDRHTITVADLNRLQWDITDLLDYFVTEFPSKFVTVNVHYYMHFVEQIKSLGPMRICANFSREHLIQKLKPFYSTTNHTHTEISIFRQYTISLFFNVLDYASGSITDDCRR
jgi:hypothetical protein